VQIITLIYLGAQELTAPAGAAFVPEGVPADTEYKPVTDADVSYVTQPSYDG
jgi:hypothetical protein